MRRPAVWAASQESRLSECTLPEVSVGCLVLKDGRRLAQNENGRGGPDRGRANLASHPFLWRSTMKALSTHPPAPPSPTPPTPITVLAFGPNRRDVSPDTWDYCCHVTVATTKSSPGRPHYEALMDYSNAHLDAMLALCFTPDLWI
ncbi:hypothetical protein SprV_0100038400 [Sparganum proliferum]